MTLIGTKVINRKYDEITSYVNVGLFQNNGITCIILNFIHLSIKYFSVGQMIDSTWIQPLLFHLIDLRTNWHIQIL